MNEIKKEIDDFMSGINNQCIEFFNKLQKEYLKPTKIKPVLQPKVITKADILKGLKKEVETIFNIPDLQTKSRKEINSLAKAVFCQVAKKIDKDIPLVDISLYCYGIKDHASVIHRLRNFFPENITNENQIKCYLYLLAKYNLKDIVFEGVLAKLEAKKYIDFTGKENCTFITLNNKCRLKGVWINPKTNNSWPYEIKLDKSQRIIYLGKIIKGTFSFKVGNKKLYLQTKEGDFQIPMQGFINMIGDKISSKDLEEVPV